MTNSITKIHKTFGIGILLGFWVGFILRGGLL